MSGANGSMQSTNYTTDRRRPGHAASQARGLQDAARSAQARSTTSTRATAVRSSRTSCGGSRRRAGPAAENFVTQNYPNKNFVPGTTPPFLLNNTTMTYNPDLTAAAADGMGRRRQLQGTDAAAVLAGRRRRTRSAPTTTTRSAIAGSNSAHALDAREALQRRVLLPLLRSAAAVVLAGDQQAAARSRHVAPPGDVGHGSIAPFNVVDPLAIGVHGQQPQFVDAQLHAADHQLPRRRRARRTRRATTRTRGRTSRPPT